MAGQYFSSKDKGSMNMLIWYGDKGYFIIRSNLDKEEILNVDENIK